MVATIATIDLKIIHENNLFVREVYPEYSERYLCFLATCLHLDPIIDLNIALKLRPFGGIIGIDNSSLDKYFKSFNILSLSKFSLFSTTLPVLFMNLAKKDRVTHTFYLVQSQTSILVT